MTALLTAQLSLFAILALSTSTAAQSPSAEPTSRTEARSLGAQGIEAFLANDFATARARLDHAYQLFATPTLGLWSARSRARLGLWVEAVARYRETTRTSAAVGDSAAQKAAQQEAVRELAELLPRVPRLTIELVAAVPSAVEVRIDDVVLTRDAIGIPQSVNPGPHTLVAARGGERYERILTLQPGEHAIVPFEFGRANAPPLAAAQPAAAAAPGSAPSHLQPTAASTDAAAQPTAGPSILEPVSIVAMSVGAAALLASGVAVLVARSELEECPKRGSVLRCKSDTAVDAYERARTAATISFYTGIVLGGAGLVTWLVADSDDEAPRALSWEVGPAGIRVSGAL